ncbi:MAG: DUF3623 family protein [Gemmatimonadales bacterium]|nr:DUF3623 family protein [Gemmatimonadales bacterium]
MSGTLAPPADAAAVPAPAAAPGTWRAIGRAYLRVIGFWWLATGLIVALQRSRATILLALGVATLCAVQGVRLVHRTRDERTARSAQVAFVGGAFVWLWIQTLFYGGWVVGPADGVLVSAPGPTLQNFLLAIRATAYNEALSGFALAWALAVHHRNPAGWQTLAAFWGADQLAKLNVFVGVVNPAAHFLPEHLYFLLPFFGPARRTVLLGASVALLAAITAWCFAGAARARDPFTREAQALLAALLSLATLEHVLLGVAWQAPLWEPFLRARGG